MISRKRTLLNEDFEIHDTLNPKIWDENGKLYPEIRQKIIDIVANFEEYIEIPIHIVDVVLVGSNASYNYTQHSDLDVHIIVNPEFTPEIPEDVLKIIYDAKKSSFNKTFDIKLKGVPVEVYVEDIKTNVVSNGIYSVCDDKWIKEPKQNKSITKHNVENELASWMEKISEVLQSGDYDQIANAIDTLYLMRKNSIAIDGEYGKGNEIFKTLRDRGYLDKLKEELNKALSKQLSLESLHTKVYYSQGQYVNRHED